MTLYNTQESIEFDSSENMNKKPTKVIDVFHSQFMLNRNKYIDNNNFVRYNHVAT